MRDLYRCERCKEYKPRSDFHKNEGRSARHSVDGISTRCKDCKRAYQRAWRLKNRDRRRGYDLDRRALCPLVPRRVEWWVAVLRADPCSYCGARSDTVDHVTPVALGGETDEQNMVGACRRCNSSKGTLRVLQFILRSA